MAQDLWTRPDEVRNETGEGWDNTYRQNGQNTGYGYQQNSYGYQQGGYQQNNYQQNGYGYQQNAYGNQPGAAVYGNGFVDASPAVSLSTYIGKTFLWMFGGLLLTAVIAYFMAASGLTFRLIVGGGSVALIGITIAELAVVIIMSARIRKMTPAGAAFCFLLYAALTGVTFSMYFLLFDLQVLVYAFAATGLFFGGMAAASLIFKMELSSIRPYLFGGLIFLILFGVLSMIFNLGAFNTAVCYIGIAIFLAYTAYDTAKIKENYAFYAGNGEMLAKASIFSALQLYLDFVNLFLYILRILGRNRK